ncbi:hypothetical protein P7C73_g2140, partial [Tremellales sp. Uapishka_1]
MRKTPERDKTSTQKDPGTPRVTHNIAMDDLPPDPMVTEDLARRVASRVGWSMDRFVNYMVQRLPNPPPIPTLQYWWSVQQSSETLDMAALAGARLFADKLTHQGKPPLTRQVSDDEVQAICQRGIFIDDFWRECGSYRMPVTLLYALVKGDIVMVAALFSATTTPLGPLLPQLLINLTGHDPDGRIALHLLHANVTTWAVIADAFPRNEIYINPYGLYRSLLDVILPLGPTEEEDNAIVCLTYRSAVLPDWKTCRPEIRAKMRQVRLDWQWMADVELRVAPVGNLVMWSSIDIVLQDLRRGTRPSCLAPILQVFPLLTSRLFGYEREAIYLWFGQIKRDDDWHVGKHRVERTLAVCSCGKDPCVHRNAIHLYITAGPSRPYGDMLPVGGGNAPSTRDAELLEGLRGRRERMALPSESVKIKAKLLLDRMSNAESIIPFPSHPSHDTPRGPTPPVPTPPVPTPPVPTPPVPTPPVPAPPQLPPPTDKTVGAMANLTRDLVRQGGNPKKPIAYTACGLALFLISNAITARQDKEITTYLSELVLGAELNKDKLEDLDTILLGGILGAGSADTIQVLEDALGRPPDNLAVTDCFVRIIEKMQDRLRSQDVFDLFGFATRWFKDCIACTTHDAGPVVEHYGIVTPVAETPGEAVEVFFRDTYQTCPTCASRGKSREMVAKRSLLSNFPSTLALVADQHIHSVSGVVQLNSIPRLEDTTYHISATYTSFTGTPTVWIRDAGDEWESFPPSAIGINDVHHEFLIYQLVDGGVAYHNLQASDIADDLAKVMSSLLSRRALIPSPLGPGAVQVSSPLLSSAPSARSPSPHPSPVVPTPPMLSPRAVVPVLSSSPPLSSAPSARSPSPRPPLAAPTPLPLPPRGPLSALFSSAPPAPSPSPRSSLPAQAIPPVFLPQPTSSPVLSSAPSYRSRPRSTSIGAPHPPLPAARSPSPIGEALRPVSLADSSESEWDEHDPRRVPARGSPSPDLVGKAPYAPIVKKLRAAQRDYAAEPTKAAWRTGRSKWLAAWKELQTVISPLMALHGIVMPSCQKLLQDNNPSPLWNAVQRQLDAWTAEGRQEPSNVVLLLGQVWPLGCGTDGPFGIDSLAVQSKTLYPTYRLHVEHLGFFCSVLARRLPARVCLVVGPLANLAQSTTRGDVTLKDPAIQYAIAEGVAELKRVCTDMMDYNRIVGWIHAYNHFWTVVILPARRTVYIYDSMPTEHRLVNQMLSKVFASFDGLGGHVWEFRQADDVLLQNDDCSCGPLTCLHIETAVYWTIKKRPFRPGDTGAKFVIGDSSGTAGVIRLRLYQMMELERIATFRLVNAILEDVPGYKPFVINNPVVTAEDEAALTVKMEQEKKRYKETENKQRLAIQAHAKLFGLGSRGGRKGGK